MWLSVANVVLVCVAAATVAVLVAVVVIQLTQGKAGSDACTTDAQCNDHGKCVQGFCRCDEGWSGVFCDVVKSTSRADYYTADCNVLPVECNSDKDCQNRCTDANFKCQDPGENVRNLKGKYCIDPVKPKLECDPNYGGNWVWSGWSDVQNMTWRCEADYPNIFPEGTRTPLAADVCQDYNYPGDGSLPEGNFTCSCDVDCATDVDCPYQELPRKCIRGFCLFCDCQTKCKETSECPGAEQCIQGQCIDPTKHRKCGEDAECNAQLCVDGKCKLKTGWNAQKTGPTCVLDSCPSGQVWQAETPGGPLNPYQILGKCVPAKQRR